MHTSFEYTGVIHCHTDYSDGRASVKEVIKEAQKARLDYLIITDHNTLAPRRAYPEGFYDGLLVLYGVEVTPRYNHYVALGVDTCPDPTLLPDRYMEETSKQGGFGFVAHPHDKGSRFLFHPSYEWKSFPVPSMEGMEVWSFMSSWVGYCQSFFATLQGLCQPKKYFNGPDPRTLRLWDKEIRKRPVVGIGAVDAHALRTWVLGRSLTALSHRTAFSTVRSNIVLETPLSDGKEEAIRQVLQALRQGSVYICDYSQKFRGGVFFGGSREGRQVKMGEEVDGDKPVDLRAKLPQDGWLRVIKDGECIYEGKGQTWEKEAASFGVYRLEAGDSKNKRPYVLSNPIYVRGKD